MSNKLAGGIKANSQSVSILVLLNAATGLAHNTAGLSAYYVRQGGTKTAIALVALAAIDSAWASGGFKEVNVADIPALYRLDVPDAAFAAGVEWVTVIVTYNGGDAWYVERFALETQGAAEVHALLTTVAGYVDSEVAAIKAKTDNLPVDPADESSIQASLTIIGNYIDTEVLAIKAKTDLIPATPSAHSAADVAALILTTPANKLATDASGRVTIGAILQAVLDAILDGAWDELLAGHAAVGSAGKALADVAALGDPWAIAVPAAYGAGTAGNILGNRLDVAVSTRAAGAGAGLNETTVRVLSAGNPVIGALVSVMNQANTGVIAHGVTNSQGDFVFYIANGTYNVRIATTPGYAPIAPTQIIVNADGQTFQINLTAQEPDPPASPLLCRVYGFIYSTDGLPAAGKEIKFTLETTGAAEIIFNAAFLDKKVIVTASDATGYFFADVLRSSQVNPWVAAGNSVKYTVTGSVIDPSKSITVPDAETYDLMAALPAGS